jgi:osmotically-inducible protein OsmY
MVSSGLPVEYLIQHVREALAADERVAELGIDLEVHDEDVYVKGDVATPERRDAIEQVVRELVPDRKVHNQIGIEEIFDSDTTENLK